MDIIIGTRVWSTWSMRPWLALEHTGVAFDETLIPLREHTSSEAVAAASPSALVPVLKDGDLIIWDSLAICEYLAEAYPAAGLWPTDIAARALARSAAAEVHSGFASLRGECPMDLAKPVHTADLSEATKINIRRIVRLCGDLLSRFDGPFLCGSWGIADAFLTPIATRFRTYGVRLSDYSDDGEVAAYMTALLEAPEFLAWEAAALTEAAG